MSGGTNIADHRLSGPDVCQTILQRLRIIAFSRSRARTFRCLSLPSSPFARAQPRPGEKPREICNLNFLVLGIRLPLARSHAAYRRHERSERKRYHERLRAGADCRLRCCLPPPRHPPSATRKNMRRCRHAFPLLARLPARFLGQWGACHAVWAWLVTSDRQNRSGAGTQTTLLAALTCRIEGRR